MFLQCVREIWQVCLKFVFCLFLPFVLLEISKFAAVLVLFSVCLPGSFFLFEISKFVVVLVLFPRLSVSLILFEIVKFVVVYVLDVVVVVLIQSVCFSVCISLPFFEGCVSTLSSNRMFGTFAISMANRKSPWSPFVHRMTGMQDCNREHLWHAHTALFVDCIRSTTKFTRA